MKSTKNIVFTVFAMSVLLLPISLFAEQAQKHNYKPKEGYVQDEETAIKIAIAVWTPIYGKEIIESERPYNATLINRIWYVTGTLPEGMKIGGVAEAEIDKDDGRIIRISHGK